MKTFKEFFTEAKQKHSKEEAGYVGHTVKGQRCDECTMWRAPNKCSAVAGDIKPEAWCKWWKKSKRKDLHESTSEVGGNHWGPIQGADGKIYNLYVKDVCNAADKTVKAVNEPVEKFVPPTNLRKPENVEKYKQSIINNQFKWTPVYCQLYENKYYAYDGNHRIAAAIEANKIKPGIVKTIPVRDVDGIINQTIENFKNGKKTIIGGVDIKIK